MGIGIPYARVRVLSGGDVEHICPICDLAIAEMVDEVGELETNRYAEHYQRLHQAAPIIMDCEMCDGECEEGDLICDDCAARIEVSQHIAKHGAAAIYFACEHCDLTADDADTIGMIAAVAECPSCSLPLTRDSFRLRADMARVEDCCGRCGRSDIGMRGPWQFSDGTVIDLICDACVEEVQR